MQPLFFGTAENGTPLGYVITGYVVDPALVQPVNRSSAAEFAFLSRGRVVTSTLPTSLWSEFTAEVSRRNGHTEAPSTVLLGPQQYLISLMDLSSASSSPLQLAVLKSFTHAERALRELNRLLISIGACALLAGTLLMLAISGFITGPLEQLTRSVQEYGRVAGVPVLPPRGTREVRVLRDAFLSMSDEIHDKNQALLESERLATIGRMVSSVLHDLRHYLAAVYANAEFLVSSRLSEAERLELFDEIRMAVHGTTDLIDSLLIFSRSNGATRRAPELLVGILDRALALHLRGIAPGPKTCWSHRDETTEAATMEPLGHAAAVASRCCCLSRGLCRTHERASNRVPEQDVLRLTAAVDKAQA